MGREEHGLSGRGVLLEPGGEGLLALGVEAPRRLVQNEQVRFGHRDRREREPLPLAAREVARMAALRPAEPDALQRCASPLFIPVHGQRRPPRAPSP